MTAFNFGSKVLHAATVVAVLLCSSIQSVSGFAFSTSLTSPSRGLARPQHNLQRKPQLFMTSVELDNDFPSCVPFPEVLEIKEDKAIDVLKSIRQVSLPVPEYIAELTVETSYVKVGPSRAGAAAGAGRAAPLVLLHGFDSSVCEFRRLLPELDARGQETHALDILGWGFNQYLGVKDFSPRRSWTTCTRSGGRWWAGGPWPWAGPRSAGASPLSSPTGTQRRWSGWS
ncbi:unnamed protein product [Heterosigma akashiwo]